MEFKTTRTIYNRPPTCSSSVVKKNRMNTISLLTNELSQLENEKRIVELKISSVEKKIEQVQEEISSINEEESIERKGASSRIKRITLKY